MQSGFYESGKRIAFFAIILAMITGSGSAQETVIIAHRGASAVAPENTHYAFFEALRLGATVIEFDVRETKDGKLVLFHDDKLERIIGRKGSIETEPWEKVKQFDVGRWFKGGSFVGARPLLLEDAIQLCLDGGATPLIEHKSGSASSYVSLIREMEVEEKVIVQSFDWKFLREFQQGAPGVRTGALGSKMLSSDKFRQITDLKPDWVGWKFSDLSESNLDALQSAGFRVALWTVNDPTEAKRWIERGVDAIITDSVDTMLWLVSAPGSEGDNGAASAAE